MENLRQKIQDAVKQFGEYALFDKGLHDIMDVPTNELLSLPPEQVATILNDLYVGGEDVMQQAAQDIVSYLNGSSTEEWWEAMYSKLNEDLARNC